MLQISSSTVDHLRQRQQMVECQLRERGISEPHVLAAMRSVPREQFVPAELEHAAYDDSPLPIACGQTISQPYTVAFMCEALQLEGGERVLEIGTGSGYAAAVLSQLVPHIWTVERIPALAESAQRRLQHLGYSNVSVRTANGVLGWPEEAPFDAIVVTAAAKELPQAYVDQLRDGGRIVIPIGYAPRGQSMCRYTRRGAALKLEDLGSFSFVPLIDSTEALFEDEPVAWG